MGVHGYMCTCVQMCVVCLVFACVFSMCIYMCGEYIYMCGMSIYKHKCALHSVYACMSVYVCAHVSKRVCGAVAPMEVLYCALVSGVVEQGGMFSTYALARSPRQGPRAI